jgi:hypothetical protein
MTEYQQYTQKDAETDGISYTVSVFSTKLCDGDKVIGKIIFEDKPLNIPVRNGEPQNDAERYYHSLNSANSFYLRKITFLDKYRYSGMLEGFFAYVTESVLPPIHLIWCVPSVCDKDGLIEQLGGLNMPLYPLPNKAIRLFSINL